MSSEQTNGLQEQGHANSHTRISCSWGRACMKRSSNASHQRKWLPRAEPGPPSLPPSSRPVQSNAAAGAELPGPARRS